MHDDRPPRGQRKPDPDGNHGTHGHCSVSGDITVAGKIETNLPHDFVQTYNASNKESNARDKNRFVVEIITLVFVALVGVFGGIQTRQAIKSSKAAITAANAAASQAKTSAEQLELTERPWVSTAPSIGSYLWFNVNGINLSLNINLHNSGLTPSVGAYASPKMFPPFEQGSQTFDIKKLSQDQITKACESAKSIANLGTDLIPPNGNSPETVTFNQDPIRLQTGMPAGSLMIQIPICVAYKTTFNDKVYTYGQIYKLYRKDPVLGETPLFPNGVTIDRNVLILKLPFQLPATIADRNYTVQ